MNDYCNSCNNRLINGDCGFCLNNSNAKKFGYLILCISKNRLQSMRKKCRCANTLYGVASIKYINGR